MTMMRLEYDLNVGALYISPSDQAVARTHEVDDNTSVDLDADGQLVGIEVISLMHRWPLSDILATYDIPADEAAQLRAYFFPRLPAATRVPAEFAARAPVQPPTLSTAPVLAGV